MPPWLQTSKVKLTASNQERGEGKIRISTDKSVLADAEVQYCCLCFMPCCDHLTTWFYLCHDLLWYDKFEESSRRWVDVIWKSLLVTAHYCHVFIFASWYFLYLHYYDSRDLELWLGFISNPQIQRNRRVELWVCTPVVFLQQKSKEDTEKDFLWLPIKVTFSLY